MSASMRVVVAGATGALGSQICERLLDLGASVAALTRDPAGPAAEGLARLGIEVVRADLEAGLGLGAVGGASCVVSTATSFPRDQRPEAIATLDEAGNIALVEAAAAAAVPRFVFVSFKPIALDFPLQRAKRAVEEQLAASGLDAVVLRPGKFMDIWFSPLCGFDTSAGQVDLFGDGASPVTWISARDVAQIAARCALGEAAPGTLELGGPEALSQRDVVAIYEALLGRPLVCRHVDVALLEQRLTGASHPLDASLAALMLETHLGAVTDTRRQQEAVPLQLERVDEFARRRVS